ncbi:MAG: hypothetical protein Q9M26_06075, partial [Mariprofundales bacterium]|nr:hypothetical protein [Mariprofundales bacterium]
ARGLRMLEKSLYLASCNNIGGVRAEKGSKMVTTQLTSDFPDSGVEKCSLTVSKLRFFALLSEKPEAI